MVGLDVPGQLYATHNLSGLMWHESVIHCLEDFRLRVEDYQTNSICGSLAQSPYAPKGVKKKENGVT